MSSARAAAQQLAHSPQLRLRGPGMESAAAAATAGGVAEAGPAPGPAAARTTWAALPLVDQFNRLRTSTDSFVYVLLALGLEAQAVKTIRCVHRLTPGEAVTLALGVWGALMSLAWYLLPSSSYPRYRTAVVFAVRLHLVLLPLTVPLVARKAVPDLAEFVHIATLSSGWVSGLALTAVFLPLPLQLHALLCLAAALVIPPNAAATCSKPCMANPVSAARADAWLRLLQRLAILRPVRQQLAGLGPFSACRALLVANHYVWGILLPTLLVVEMQQAAGRRLWRYLLGWQGWGAPAGGSRVTWLAVANRLLLYVCMGQLLVAGVLYYFATFGEQGEPAS